MDAFENMTQWPALAGLTLLAYLVGSTNLSIITSKWLGRGDPRAAGSGNAGATNLLRSAGPKVALPVLLLDFSKAFAVIWLSGLFLPNPWAPMMIFPLLLGNIYPLFHGFRGGKGVAAAVGGFLAISPLIVLLGGTVFIVMMVLFHRVSLASLSMLASWPLGAFATREPRVTVLVALGAALLVFVTHRANIHRLLRGMEPKITGRPK